MPYFLEFKANYFQQTRPCLKKHKQKTLNFYFLTRLKNCNNDTQKFLFEMSFTKFCRKCVDTSSNGATLLAWFYPVSPKTIWPNNSECGKLTQIFLLSEIFGQTTHSVKWYSTIWPSNYLRGTYLINNTIYMLTGIILMQFVFQCTKINFSIRIRKVQLHPVQHLANAFHTFLRWMDKIF